MLVRFIAHAGISIEEAGHSLLIDPWFLDSTVENPLIESIAGGWSTIDFQIPKTEEPIERHTPDAILVSHFHPHHSPARDIKFICDNSLALGRTMQLLYPSPNEAMEATLSERVPKGIARKGVTPNEKFKIGPFSIQSLEHTVPFHTAWHVSSTTGSVLHIADGRLNKDRFSRKPDAAWENIKGLSPSLFLLSIGGHSQRVTEKDGKRSINEAGIFTAVEGAQITQLVNPKAAAAIGIYNHSIWKNRLEYIRSTPQSEEEFQWALSWLTPGTKNLHLVPGCTIGIGDSSLQGTCDTYIG
jgi:L-ascorbate metabolism protein UlaG (beta-lactamase superfamily)